MADLDHVPPGLFWIMATVSRARVSSSPKQPVLTCRSRRARRGFSRAAGIECVPGQVSERKRVGTRTIRAPEGSLSEAKGRRVTCGEWAGIDRNEHRPGAQGSASPRRRQRCQLRFRRCRKPATWRRAVRINGKTRSPIHAAEPGGRAGSRDIWSSTRCSGAALQGEAGQRARSPA